MSKVLRSVGSEMPQFWCVGWVNVCTVSYYKDWIDNNGFTAKWTTERASYFKTKKSFNGIILFEHLFFENPSLSVRMEGRGWGEKRMLHYLFLTIFSYYGGCWAAKPGSLVIEHNSMTDNNMRSPRDNLQSPVWVNIKHKTEKYFCCSQQGQLTADTTGGTDISVDTPLSLLHCLHGN